MERNAASRAYNLKYPERVRENTLRCSRVTGWDRALVTKSRHDAKKKSLPFTIDLDFVKELFKKQNGRCYWFGIALVPSIEHRAPDRPSLDRLDCKRGYTKDNVVLTCQFANIGRGTTCVERMNKFLAVLKEACRE